MKPESDPVESLFATVLAKPAEERAAYLDHACAGDALLRLRVEALLKARAEATGQSFLTGPYRGLSPVHPAAEGPGTRIGPYKLLQQIGEGGMGVVYMADQEQPVRRRVALKIIKPGMDSAQVIARFEAERQALAMMDHPNIAKVLDAGMTGGEPGCVSAGRPYFVMDLVKGVPITRFCDENKLTPRERLELFIPVCQAIQHAHQKGIVHRDVKPSNVLVTLYDGRPVPKVIDFGVAKALHQPLTQRTMFTAFGQMIGTLEYMAPEQAEMNALDVDTRSDIYSLGVVLCELLTGSTPLSGHHLRQAAHAEVLRLIREEEVPRPSTLLRNSGEQLASISAQRRMEPAKLTRLLRGELDWIMMKALEKERSRRYETANGLARDIERYLHDEPVEACPPSVGYRLRKVARKHRALLATVTAFVILLATAAAVSTWLAVQTKRAEGVADEKRQKAEQAQLVAAEEGALATKERRHAQDETERANKNEAQTRRTLDRISVGKGIRLADEGDFCSALPWLASPLSREGLTQEEEQVHRTRLACYLRYTPGRPRLRHIFFCDNVQRRGSLLPTSSSQPLQFSADGKRLLVMAEAVVYVWDLRGGNLLATLPSPNPSEALGQLSPPPAQFSPDGTRILTAPSGEPSICTWDVASGQRVGCFTDLGGLMQRPLAILATSPWQAIASACADPPYSDFVGLQISRDGKRASFQYTCGERLVELATHRLIGEWPATSVEDTFTRVLSPDGKWLLVRDGNMARVHLAEPGKTASRLIDYGGPIEHVACSADGTRALTVGKDGRAAVWDTLTWQPLARLRLTESNAHFKFSPDNRLLAGDRIGNLALWDVESGVRVRELPDNDFTIMPGIFDWRPDGKQFAWVPPSFGDSVRLYDTTSDSKKSLVLPQFGAAAAVYAPDGRTLATAGSDGVIRIWDLCDLGEALTCKSPEKDDFATELHERRIARGVTNPDIPDIKGAFGTKTVKGSEEDARPDPERLLPPGTSYRGGIVSPDRSRVITGHEVPEKIAVDTYQVLKLWNAKTRERIGKPLDSTAGRPQGAEWSYTYTCVAFSPNSCLFAAAVSASNEVSDMVQLYSAKTGEAIGKPMRHDGRVFFVAFSPDSELLVTCSEDSTARLWRAKTGEAVGESLRHGDYVMCAAFSPNGKLLATASFDGTIRLWEVGRGTPTGVLELKDGIPSDLAFHPNGSILMVSYFKDTDWRMRLIDVASLQEVSPAFEGTQSNSLRSVHWRPRADGRVVFGVSEPRTWNLAPDTRPTDDLIKLAALHAQRHLDPKGDLLPLTKEQLQSLWQELHAKYHQEFTVPDGAAMEWRIGQIPPSYIATNAFSVAFHRRWLAAELADVGWQPAEQGNEHMERDNYLQRLFALALHGRHAEAVPAAEALAARWSKDSETLYDCARVLSLAASAVKEDAALAEKYGVRAVALLRQAVDAGYKNVEWIRKDPDLDSLRGRDDFQKLLKDLDAKRP